MSIVREDVGDALLTHRQRRDAIREAVAFVRSGFEEGDAVQRGLVGLVANHDARIAQDTFHKREG